MESVELINFDSPVVQNPINPMSVGEQFAHINANRDGTRFRSACFTRRMAGVRNPSSPICKLLR